jgi:hypothetical protein
MTKQILALTMGALTAATLMLASAPADAAQKSYLVGNFEELVVEGDMQVIVDNARNPSAKASGDRDILDALKIERFGTTVRVRIQDYEGKTNIKPRTLPLIVNLGSRGVGRISVDGSASVSINKIAAPGATATLKLSGPGSISVGNMESDRLSISIAGSGSINIDGGKARIGRFGIDGNATLKAPLVTLQQAQISQAGNANTHLLVTDSIEISNSGAGAIRIDGKSTCFIKQAGAARISCNKTPAQ